MRTFLRLLSYIFPYSYRFFWGVIFSFFVALLSGVSLSIFVPIFDAMGKKSDIYLSQFSKRERNFLKEIFPTDKEGEGFQLSSSQLPQAPERLNQQLAKFLVSYIDDNHFIELDTLSYLELKTIIYGKLRLSASGFSPLEVMFLIGMIVVPIWILKTFLLLMCVRLLARAGYLAIRRIRDDLYSKIQDLPLTWYYKNKSGELVSRIGNDSEIISAVISDNMRDAIVNIFYLFVNISILAYLNWELFLTCILVMPFLLFPTTLLTHKIRKSTHRSQHLLAELHGHLQESLSGIKEIRYMQMEEREKEKFRDINNKLYWKRFKELYYNRLIPYLVELNSIIIVFGILSLGAIFLDSSDFTSAEFLVFLAVLLFIIRPIIQLSGMYAKIQGAIAAGKRIFEIMDKDVEFYEVDNPSSFQKLENAIDFNNVCFSYPETEKQVLYNIDLNVPVGSTIAIVGESGGGKSTLMDLLLGFFTPTSGQILLDGKSIQSFRIEEHRSRIGIVSQDIFLFYGSIFNNISYGKRNCDPHEVEKAARLAHAHDFICSFDNGYNSLVGNRGFNLSGGQRQRIAIARAFLRDPEILILDEATSALDNKNERLIQQALKRLFHKRTTFVIAHRLSTIENADTIVVLSNGHIVEVGSHHKLMEKNGHYKRLQTLDKKV